LTLNLTTPGSPRAISEELSENEYWDYILGSAEGNNAPTLDPANGGSVTVASVGDFSCGNGHNIMRSTDDIFEAGYMNNREIYYIYVSGDITIAREAKTIGNRSYNAVNLPLKTGWNLVQVDRKRPQSGGGNHIFTVKIADKDIPWRYYMPG
jgi:hypothetical protein